MKTAPGETSVFQGIDTSLRGLAALAGSAGGCAEGRARHGGRRAVERAIAEFHPLHPERAVPDVAKALVEPPRGAQGAADGPGRGRGREGRTPSFLLAIEEHDAELALQRAAGAVMDALSDDETVAPGESLRATVRLFLANPSLVTVEGVSLKAPSGWTVTSTEPSQPDASNFMARFFRENADRTDAFSVAGSWRCPSQPAVLARRAAPEVHLHVARRR